MFDFEPLGKGKLGIVLPSSTPDPSPHPPEEETSFKLTSPFDRDLSGFTLDTMESVCCASPSSPSKLEETWKQAGIPDSLSSKWLEQSTLGYFLTCIKNPSHCEPKSLIFWVSKTFKVGFDQRDGINIFFLAWRHHLTIDLDDCPGHDPEIILQSRLKLLSDLSKRKNLCFAIYRTDRGFHAIELTRKWDPTNPKVLSLVNRVGGDIRYAAISALQGFRLRLSPKSKTPNDFVVRRYATGNIHPELGTLIVGNPTHIPPKTLELMNLYLNLASSITSFVRSRIDLSSPEIMFNSELAYQIRDLVQNTTNSLKDDLIWDQPFKSVSLAFDSLLNF